MASKLADRLVELADREFPEKEGRALRALSLKCELSPKAVATLVTRLRDANREDGGDMRTFRRIAAATGCRLEWLTEGSGPMYATPSADALNNVLDERPWPDYVIAAAKAMRREASHWTAAEWRDFMQRLSIVTRPDRSDSEITGVRPTRKHRVRRTR